MPRFLYVVARDRLDLHDHLVGEFAREPGVRVVLDRRRGDRRRGERRQGAGRGTHGRRARERRRRPELEQELRVAGCFMVEAEGGAGWD